MMLRLRLRLMQRLRPTSLLHVSKQQKPTPSNSAQIHSIPNR